MVATVPPAPSSGFTAAPTAALRRALSAAASPAFVAVVSTANESWARSGVARTSPCPLTTSVRRSPARSCASAKHGTATRSQHATCAIRDPYRQLLASSNPRRGASRARGFTTPGPDLRDERLPRRAIVAGVERGGRPAGDVATEGRRQEDAARCRHPPPRKPPLAC